MGLVPGVYAIFPLDISSISVLYMFGDTVLKWSFRFLMYTVLPYTVFHANAERNLQEGQEDHFRLELLNIRAKIAEHSWK
jgi:hypothetical protein